MPNTYSDFIQKAIQTLLVVGLSCGAWQVYAQSLPLVATPAAPTPINTTPSETAAPPNFVRAAFVGCANAGYAP